jgi:hypothetical protein
MYSREILHSRVFTGIFYYRRKFQNLHENKNWTHVFFPKKHCGKIILIFYENFLHEIFSQLSI